MAKEPIDIIIPTLDNHEMLLDCMWSIACGRSEYPVRFIVVNNGDVPVGPAIPAWLDELTLVVEAGKNLGWTGGLEKGLEYSKSKYVVFANDDIYVPRSSFRWLRNIIRIMDCYPAVGAAGPSSNIVTGTQNIWHKAAAAEYSVPYLIGFCMVVRREALDKAGGVQHMEQGGDDFDLSIRLRRAGYMLVCRRDEFVYHHGFQTGERVHGRPDKPGGWNSREMIEAVNQELIRKHGFLAWWETLTAGAEQGQFFDLDTEGEIVRRHCNGGRVVELGCGAIKTLENSIGVDIVPKGAVIPYLDKISIADVTADATEELPFEDGYADIVIGRHILEHCVDAAGALQNWRRIIRPKGRLILAMPDENIRDGIPLNPEHVHAFTPESLARLAGLVGFTHIVTETGFNNHSFVTILERAN